MTNIFFSNYLFILILLIFIMIFKFKNNFLKLLIGMEFIVISVLMLIFLNCYFMLNDWLFIYYMVFSVCESVIGLTLMINLIYYYGNQNIVMLNLWW